MPIVYREEKGAPLTAKEMDGNFRELEKRLKALEESPPDAEGIAEIIGGEDTLTLRGTRGSTFGPFALPKVFWKPQGEWKPGCAYKAQDVVFFQNTLFLCGMPHLSPASFSAERCWEKIFSWQPMETGKEPDMHKNPSAFSLPLYTREALPAEPSLGNLIFIVNEGMACWTGSDWSILPVSV